MLYCLDLLDRDKVLDVGERRPVALEVQDNATDARGMMEPECCGTSHGATRWCNTDPCGVVCAGITWSLILYAQYVVTRVIIVGWQGASLMSAFNLVAFNSVAFLALYSHVKAMMTDPGAVPRNAEPLPEEAEHWGNAEEGKNAHDGRRQVRKYCKRCNSYKPPRAHHCSICQRCIVKMDHHCPWVNNCVGLGNHKLFLLFIFYIFVLSVYALMLVVARFMACLNTTDGCGDAAGNVLVVFLVIEAILFGLFTCCMMLDQWTVVSTNTTSIDRLKGEFHHSASKAADVNEVFGGKDGRFRLDWLLPRPAHFPASIVADLLGYTIQGSGHGLFMMAERRPEPTQAAVSLVSRERLDGDWSVERVEVAPDWSSSGSSEHDHTLEAEDDRDTAKLLRGSVTV